MPDWEILLEQDYSDLYNWRCECLHEAEQWFGNRNKDYEIELIAWWDKGPCISFHGNCEVRINVSKDARQRLINGDSTHVLWDVAHECVHLIDPYKGGETNNLEEGLATWFQNSKIDFPSCPTSPWAEAERWVKCAGIERLCSIVRRLRSEDVRIGDITAEQLETKGIEAGVAYELDKQFVPPRRK